MWPCPQTPIRAGGWPGPPSVPHPTARRDPCQCSRKVAAEPCWVPMAVVNDRHRTGALGRRAGSPHTVAPLIRHPGAEPWLGSPTPPKAFLVGTEDGSKATSLSVTPFGGKPRRSRFPCLVPSPASPAALVIGKTCHRAAEARAGSGRGTFAPMRSLVPLLRVFIRCLFPRCRFRRCGHSREGRTWVPLGDADVLHRDLLHAYGRGSEGHRWPPRSTAASQRGTESAWPGRSVALTRSRD